MATEGQQHPLKIYFAIWILLFVVSFFSYMVDVVVLLWPCGGILCWHAGF